MPAKKGAVRASEAQSGIAGVSSAFQTFRPGEIITTTVLIGQSTPSYHVHGRMSIERGRAH